MARPPATGPAPHRPWSGLLALLAALTLLLAGVPGGVAPAAASLANDRYDGNIYALYAGNGSLVPPRSTLAEALEAHRVAVLVFYLDDSSVSKRFAPVVSELQRVWGNAIELIPLVTDPLQNRSTASPSDPGRYWKGSIPQVVVIDAAGKVRFDGEGQINVDAINEAISSATGIPLAQGRGSSSTMSFNELNTEVTSGQR